MQQTIYSMRETKQKLKIRILEHLRNIVKNQNTVIGTHVNSANHKLNQMQINAIESLSNSTGYIVKPKSNFG